MVLDMNVKLTGITEEFLDDLDELIEDYRVEYFVINPSSSEELEKTQEICKSNERFKYTLPIIYKSKQDESCVAYRVSNEDELDLAGSMPLVIESEDLDDTFIDMLNCTSNRGIILNAKEIDNKLINFAYAVSHNSLKEWTNKGMSDTDYNKLALQSDYPAYSYDDLFDDLLKEMSDMTFRAEQTIAAGGTRTILKTFGLL